MKKRIVSMLTVLCMLISAVPALAFYPTGSYVPGLGVLCFHDFEDIPVSLAINAATYLQGYTGGKYTGGDMYYANGFVLDDAGGNNYFRHASTGANFKYGLRDRVDTTIPETNEYFNEGLLKLQYDVMVPSAESAVEQSIYYQTSNKLDDTKYRSYLNSIVSTADGAKAVFATALNRDARPQADDEHVAVIELENDKWYTITMIVDYENSKVFQFLDGVRVAAFANTYENIKNYCGFSYGGISQVGQPDAGKESEYIGIDNFLVERIAADNVKAEIVNKGKNFVDLEFDAVVLENGTYTSSNFSLKNLDGSVAPAVTEVAKLALDKFRITFAEDLAKGATYELIINADVSEAGTQNKMAKGAKIFFSTQAEGEVVLAFDANGGWSVDAPNGAEEAAAFTKYFHVGSDGTNDFASSTSKLNGFAGITSGGDGATGDNYRVLSITPTSKTAENENNSLVIPFADNQTIDSGIIEAEFEAIIDPESSGWLEMAFGLRDTKNPETEYGYNSAWGDAAQFMGLLGSDDSFTMDNGTKNNYRNLVPGIPEAKGIPAVKKLESIGTQKISPDWNEGYVVQSRISEKGNTTPDYDKYKFVADLDNDFFELYYNGEKVYTSDYMPGNVNDGVYDAFVITTNYWGAARVNWVYFDNLKVSKIDKALTIDNAEFQVGAKKASYANTVDFSANRMKIRMSEEIDDVTDLVTFSGSDMCEIYADGFDIVLEFEEGLTYNENYTVTLSKDLADIFGAKLGNDIVLSFKAVCDDITFGNPIITVDGDLLEAAGDIAENGKIEVTVNTKAGVPCSALIMVAAYKEGKLSGVAAGNISSKTGKLVLEHTADATFVGAETVKAFVFDASTIKPITIDTVIE